MALCVCEYGCIIKLMTGMYVYVYMCVCVCVCVCERERERQTVGGWSSVFLTHDRVECVQAAVAGLPRIRGRPTSIPHPHLAGVCVRACVCVHTCVCARVCACACVCVCV